MGKTLGFIRFFMCMVSFFTLGAWYDISHGAESAGKKYYYATATGYGVKLREGPGIHYKENTLRLHKHAYANAPKGIAYDDYLYGLIVDDTVVQGDATCSAWQKIVVVHTAWDSEELLKPLCETLNGTNAFSCTDDAYICKDFIKTTPVEYENYTLASKGQWLERLKKIHASH